MSEMDFNSSELANVFLGKVFDERVRAIIKEEVKCDKTYSATVISVGSGVANIRLQGATNTITNVKNKSGEILVAGNEVYVEAINGSLNNIVIKYKK